MPRRTLILVSLLLAAFVINLDTTVVNVALPALERQLGATTTQLQWVVDAYNLVFAALLLSAGNLSDRLGRKRLLVAGLVVFGAASIAGSFATATGELIAARAVMGLGAALTFPSTLSLLTGTFTERRERARAIGLWGATAGAAIALGPIVGGWLLDQFSWSSIFVAMGPVAFAGAALAMVIVPGARGDAAGRLDTGGLVLSAGAIGVLVFTIIEAPAYGWGAARSIGGFAAAAVLLVLFVLRESRSTSPMIDVRIFRNRRFSAASGAVTVAFFTLFGFIFLITQYFQFLRGYSPLSTGVHLLPVATAVAAGSVAGTQAAVRIGTKAVVAGGLLLIAAFYFWAAASTSTTLSYGVISVQMVVYGLGLGFTSAPATESIMGAIAARTAGVGSAVNDTTRLIGGTLGVAVIGSVYASLYQHRIGSLRSLGVPGGLVQASQQSLGAGLSVARHLTSGGHAALGQVVNVTTTNAFLHGLQVGCLVAAGVALAGGIAAAALLPARPAASASSDASVAAASAAPAPAGASGTRAPADASVASALADDSAAPAPADASVAFAPAESARAKLVSAKPAPAEPAPIRSGQ
jgi:EmrB/QacA subfamily drug resistance transporter